MSLQFPVHYKRDAENPDLWEARVPGIDGTEEGAYTCGGSLEDCRRMASGLVDCWILTHLKDGRAIPPPGPVPEGEGWETVHPALRVVSGLDLEDLRRENAALRGTVAELEERVRVLEGETSVPPRLTGAPAKQAWSEIAADFDEHPLGLAPYESIFGPLRKDEHGNYVPVHPVETRAPP